MSTRATDGNAAIPYITIAGLLWFGIGIVFDGWTRLGGLVGPLVERIVARF